MYTYIYIYVHIYIYVYLCMSILRPHFWELPYGALPEIYILHGRERPPFNDDCAHLLPSRFRVNLELARSPGPSEADSRPETCLVLLQTFGQLRHATGH